MPVTIIKRGAPVGDASTPTKTPKVVIKALPKPLEAIYPGQIIASEVAPKMTVKFGTSEVRPDLDLHYELGRVKFLVHIRKKSIFYEVHSFDEDTKALVLGSSYGTRFDSKIDGTVGRNYLLVVEQEGAKKPSHEALVYVQSLHDKKVDVVEGASVAPVVKKGKINITRRAK